MDIIPNRLQIFLNVDRTPFRVVADMKCSNRSFASAETSEGETEEEGGIILLSRW